jgi:hypothetical protein
MKSQRSIQPKRVVGGKNMSNAPVYRCLSLRDTTANGLLCISTETVSLHVDYNSAVYVSWVCVGEHVNKDPGTVVWKFIYKKAKKMVMENLTRQEYLGCLLAFQNLPF